MEAGKAIQKIYRTSMEGRSYPGGMGRRNYLPYPQKRGQVRLQRLRGISLLNVAYKIFTSDIKKRMKPYVERIIGEYQAGFYQNKSTIDQLFFVR